MRLRRPVPILHAPRYRDGKRIAKKAFQNHYGNSIRQGVFPGVASDAPPRGGPYRHSFGNSGPGWMVYPLKRKRLPAFDKPLLRVIFSKYELCRCSVCTTQRLQNPAGSRDTASSWRCDCCYRFCMAGHHHQGSSRSYASPY